MLIGTVEVLSPDDEAIFDGDPGAFVNVAALCEDEASFSSQVAEAMVKLNLQVCAIRDVEVAETRLARKEPTAELQDLISRARGLPGRVALGVFYSYPSHDAVDNGS